MDSTVNEGTIFIQKREGPHEEAEIRRMVLRRGKTWPSAKIHV